MRQGAWCSAGVALALAGVATPARAEGPRVAVSYRAPPDCPASDVFEDEVRHRLRAVELSHGEATAADCEQVARALAVQQLGDHHAAWGAGLGVLGQLVPCPRSIDR